MNLRPTFDRSKQSSNIQMSKTNRHKGYLKDMLVQKYNQKYRSYLTLNDKDKINDERVTAVILKEFDRFIDQQTFTQQKLKVFETDLTNKLNGILGVEGNMNHKTLQHESSRYNKNTQLYKSIDRNNSSMDVNNTRIEHNISLPQIITKK